MPGSARQVAKGGEQAVECERVELLAGERAERVERLHELGDVGAAVVAAGEMRLETRAVGRRQRVVDVGRDELDELGTVDPSACALPPHRGRVRREAWNVTPRVRTASDGAACGS